MSDNASLILQQIIGKMLDVKYIVNFQMPLLTPSEKRTSLTLASTIEDLVSEIRTVLLNELNRNDHDDKKLLLETPDATS